MGWEREWVEEQKELQGTCSLNTKGQKKGKKEETKRGRERRRQGGPKKGSNIKRSTLPVHVNLSVHTDRVTHRHIIKINKSNS